MTTPTKETPYVAPPDTRHTAGADTHRHGPSAQRADGVTGEPGAQFRRTPGAARRVRDDRQECPPAHPPLAAGERGPTGTRGGVRASHPRGAWSTTRSSC